MVIGIGYIRINWHLNIKKSIVKLFHIKPFHADGEEMGVIAGGGFGVESISFFLT